jgi:hypothetical protein
MIKDCDRLNAIVNERDALRAEMAESAKYMRYAMFAFLTLVASGFAVVLDENSKVDNELAAFVVSQLEVFLAYVGLNSYAKLTALSGYIAAKEEQINDLCGQPLSTFELHVMSGKSLSRYKPGILGGVVVAAALVVTCATFMIMSPLAWHPWIRLLAIVEGGLLFLGWIAAFKQRDVVRRNTLEL